LHRQNESPSRRNSVSLQDNEVLYIRSHANSLNVEVNESANPIKTSDLNYGDESVDSDSNFMIEYEDDSSIEDQSFVSDEIQNALDNQFWYPRNKSLGEMSDEQVNDSIFTDPKSITPELYGDEFLVSYQVILDRNSLDVEITRQLKIKNLEYGLCRENQTRFSETICCKLLLQLFHKYCADRLQLVFLYRALESLVSHNHLRNASLCYSTATCSVITAGVQSHMSSKLIAESGCGILCCLLSTAAFDASSLSGESGSRGTTEANIASILGGSGACEAIIEAIDRFISYLLFL
jgi:hypothetical protein